MTKKYDLMIRGLFIICALFFMLMIPLMGDSSEKVMLIMLGFVITVGMSHGSLDWLLARRWGLRGNMLANLHFLFGYVAIVLISLSLWCLLPTVALVIFLLMSVVHFAHDWQAEMASLPQLVIGLAIVSIPAIVFQHEVQMLFSLLVPATKAVIAARVLQCIAYGALFGACLIAIQEIKRVPSLSAEILVLLLSGILLPPLIYFSLYFCLLHTTKHWYRLSLLGVYQHWMETLWSALWPTLLAFVIGSLACYESSALSFSNAFVRTVFIGLAALTVPHWLLVEVYPVLGRRKLSQL